MLTETHCSCGHCLEADPAKLPPKLACSKCGQVSVFGQTSDGDEEGPRWLVVGGNTGPARLAVAVPRAETLKIGRAADAWLILPGDDVAGANTEVSLREDRRLSVKHLAEEGETWIGRAKIISGVLGCEDEMRIGNFVIRLRTSASLADGDAADVPVVVVDDVGSDPDELSEDYDRGDSLWRRILPADASRGQVVRLWVCLIAILTSAGFVTSVIYWPSVSEEMPIDTVYTCPADGTTFRGIWDDGPPKCPQCEQLCFGAIRYSVDPQPQSQPASSQAADASAHGTQASDERGAGG
jgi:hypothetical protein